MGVSSACSVMETTRTPLRLSMDERQSTRKTAVLVGRGLGGGKRDGRISQLVQRTKLAN